MEILAEDSNTGGPSSFTVRMKYLHFNSDIVNFVWKTDEGEGGGRKHYFVNFCYLALLYLRGCGLGQKVLFRAS